MDSKKQAFCASFPVLILKYHGGCVGTESGASGAGGCFLGEKVNRVSRRAAGRPVGRSRNQCLEAGTRCPL